MAVVVTAPYVTATGNGAATSFPFALAVRNVADVAVYVNGVSQTVGFSVTLNSDFNGGTVLFTTAPANAAAILIAVQPSLSQQIKFVNSGPYNPSTVDGANDSAAIRDIFLKGLIDRAPRVPLGETIGPLPAKSARALQWSAWDINGDPKAAIPPTGPPGGPGALFGLFTNLPNITAGTATLLASSGYSVVDKGAGIYVYDPAVNSAYVAAHPLSSGITADGKGFRLSLEQDISPDMLGAGVTTDDSASFAAASALAPPAATYTLASDITAPSGDLSWQLEPGTTFSGSGNILTPGMPGFDYTPNLKNILIAVKRGSVASPRTDGDAVHLAHKTSNVGDLAGAPNPAHAALHDHYGTAVNSRSQAYYGEVVARAGGAAAFVEAARFHGIVPTGITCKAYGGLFYAQNGGTGLNCIGNEAEVRRTVASDGAVGRAWVSSGQFDGCYNATANTANATVGGVGGKPNFGFTINPFNTIAVQTGYLVPKSVVSGKTVNDAAFQCLEVGLNYGLDLAKGSYTIAIALPNNTPVTAFNAAGSAELEAWRVDTSNVLQLGAGTSGVRAAVSLGFATGAGGAVTQATSKATAVTENKSCGQITLNAASLAASTVVSFTFTNSFIAATDIIRINTSGAATPGSYLVQAENLGAGSCTVSVRNLTAGALAEALVLNFAVIKSVAA